MRIAQRGSAGVRGSLWRRTDVVVAAVRQREVPPEGAFAGLLGRNQPQERHQRQHRPDPHRSVVLLKVCSLRQYPGTPRSEVWIYWIYFMLFLSRKCRGRPFWPSRNPRISFKHGLFAMTPCVPISADGRRCVRTTCLPATHTLSPFIEAAPRDWPRLQRTRSGARRRCHPRPGLIPERNAARRRDHWGRRWSASRRRC